MKDNLPFRRLCRLLLLCLFWATLISPDLLAQTGDRTVTGTVRDEKNTGIPGVNIVIKGTGTPDCPKGTSTDVEGNYRLSVPEGAEATLQFSYIGYVSQEVVIESQTINN